MIQGGAQFDPGRRVLYLLEPGHKFTTRNQSFSVKRDDESEIIAIPHHRIGRIEIGPGVTYDEKSVNLALNKNIELIIIDGFGQTKGTLSNNKTKRAALQLSQARSVLDEIFRLEISRKLVDARIRNQRTQIKRLSRNKTSEDIERVLGVMKHDLHKIPYAQTINALRGLEGATAARYWPILGILMKQDRFKRTRPAQDAHNATINYMTAILERDIRAAIQSCALHIGFAYLHASRDRQDGLVYDLMEPFRAALTEGLAVFLFNSKRLRDDMFASSLLREIDISKQGRHAIINGYESAVARRINKPKDKSKLSWRAMMIYQASTLSKAIQAEDPQLFIPYLMET